MSKALISKKLCSPVEKPHVISLQGYSQVTQTIISLICIKRLRKKHFLSHKRLESDSFYPASERNHGINFSVIHIHGLQGGRHTVWPALGYCHVHLGCTRPEAASLVLGGEQLSSHLRVPTTNPAAILVQCCVFSLANPPWP